MQVAPELGSPNSPRLSERRRSLSLDLQLGVDIDAPTSRESSIFLGRIVGVVFMRVNSKCAHQLRPPSQALQGVGRPVKEGPQWTVG